MPRTVLYEASRRDAFTRQQQECRAGAVPRTELYEAWGGDALHRKARRGFQPFQSGFRGARGRKAWRLAAYLLEKGK